MTTRWLVNSLPGTSLATMMRTGLRAGWLALLLCSTPAAAQRSGRRVLRAADIAAAGWHRLGDIVSALPPGSVATIDGFNHQLTSSRVPFTGTQGATRAAWAVRLDGQRIPVVVDGMWILDALPVAMTQIDSVIISTGPRLVDGHATFLGTIDLYSRRPERGLSAVADYQHGDESGDPGPFRYTARSNPNVEKLGPFASGAAAFATPRWSIGGAARYSSLNITDSNIASRFPTTFGQLQSDANASGGSGALTTSFAGGTQHTIGGRGRFTGLLWVPSYGAEQSVRVIASHAGSSGALTTDRIAVRFGLTGTSLDVAELRSPLPFTIGHTRTMGEAFIEATPRDLPVAIGAGITVWRMERAGSTETEPTERLWATYDARGTAVSVTAAHGAGRVSVSASAAREWRLRDSATLAVTASHLGTTSDADGAWIDALGASTTPTRGVTMTELRGELTVERFRRMVPMLYSRVYAFRGTRAVEGSGDVRGAAGLRATTPAGSRITAFLNAEVSAFTGVAQPGDDATPRSFIDAALSTIVAGNFRLAASGRFADGTSWPVLAAGARTDLPPLERIDVSMNKPFWHERIRAQLIVRNLLQSAEAYHPLGAQWNLRTHLALTIALPPYRSATAAVAR